MPTIPLHLPSCTSTAVENPLPPLLHTPSGLALLELQGTIHFPPPPASSSDQSTLVGKLVFPLYNPLLNDPSDTKWMKRVYFYVGENQRMAGECKKLGRPFAVVRKKERAGDRGVDVDMNEELEIVEVVKYKIVFSARPEPVGRGEEAG
ncbi:hypothetical protein P153DRAFT_208637 [Dothidotthia symphoricarpi CBS 119687]|uniref:Sister chromatid cohesion protein Ctf8 n=1 Tax=Dothidotthia symphoricarpi CBS 119687 TaxID=1392245 RepID=A0A6A6AGF0_9PLEO|nr:uncharacterized protein P153DRAFT_208637 [Dothidotthia symphoricarpi CBS 119687]KAF2130999.1 hypothetical protein P153DRAFT_208637 [Dothidotthia symphoricarpi CBS 119687]